MAALQSLGRKRTVCFTINFCRMEPWLWYAAEETAPAAFPLPLVIKLLDLVLNFIYIHLILVKRQKNTSPSSESIVSVFTTGGFLSVRKPNSCCGRYNAECPIRCCHFSYQNQSELQLVNTTTGANLDWFSKCDFMALLVLDANL